MLEERLGTLAPSYVTMRRWAADGVFKSVEDGKSQGRRVRYSTVDILKLVRTRLAAKNTKPQSKRKPTRAVVTSTEQTVPPRSTPLELGGIEDVLQDIVSRQSRLETMLTETLSAAKGLNAVRLLLMNKYDAQNAANIDVISQLKARLRTAEDVQSNMKVTIALNRLSDRISDLERGLGRQG